MVRNLQNALLHPDVMPAKAGIHPAMIPVLLSAWMASRLTTRLRVTDPADADGPNERNDK